MTNDAPAQTSVETWTETRLRDHAKSKGWYVREGTSVPDIYNGGWKHPFSVTVSSSDLVEMLNASLPPATVGTEDEAVAWRAVAHPETGMGTMVSQIKWKLIEDATDLYGKGKWDLQPLYTRPTPAADGQRVKQVDPREFWQQWARKRLEISRSQWLRAAKRALDGDLRDLRLRVELAEAPPMQIVASSASLASEKEG